MMLSPRAGEDAATPLDLLRKPEDAGAVAPVSGPGNGGNAAGAGSAGAPTAPIPGLPSHGPYPAYGPPIPGGQPRPRGERAPTTRLPTTSAGKQISPGWGPTSGGDSLFRPGSGGGFGEPGEFGGPGGSASTGYGASDGHGAPGGGQGGYGASASGAPGAAVGPRNCRQCGHISAAARVRCERCGAILPQGRPAFPGPAAPYAPEPAAQRRPRWMIFAAAGAVAVLGVGGGLIIGLHGRGDNAAATGSQVGNASPAALITVPRKTIHGSASSTLSPATAYGIANTLDGDPGTAWNSNGNQDGTGAGITLTYRFDRPRHLMRITLSNGYLRSKRVKDVWHANSRLHRVRLTTDTGTRDVSLTDASTPQSLTADLGTTRVLQITVLSVYPGNLYKDLALTEIAFQATA